MINELLNHTAVKCRLAPSPTGKLHLGNLYVFLYNFIFIQKYSGKLMLRIDDTDINRNDYETSNADLITVFKAFNIKISNGNGIKQSDRCNRYQEVVNIFKHHGYTYTCCDIPNNECIHDSEKHAIFLNVGKIIAENPDFIVNSKLIVKDKIRGDIKFNINDVKDFVLLRENGYPTYHLACMVDDVDMEITHIIRAEDWITSLPKHYLLLYLLNKFIKPHKINFVHLPLIRTPDGKLSKREGSLNIQDMLQQGYLPAAIENYIFYTTMNMHDEIDKNIEIFDRKYCIKQFDLSHIRTTSPLFDVKKLTWFNRRWMNIVDINDDYIKSYFSAYVNSSFINESFFWNEAQKTYNTLEQALNIKQILCETVDFSDKHDFIIQNLALLNIVIDTLLTFIPTISDDVNDNYEQKLRSVLHFDNALSMKLVRFVFTGNERGPSIDMILRCLDNKAKIIKVQRLQSLIKTLI